MGLPDQFQFSRYTRVCTGLQNTKFKIHLVRSEFSVLRARLESDRAAHEDDDENDKSSRCNAANGESNDETGARRGYSEGRSGARVRPVGGRSHGFVGQSESDEIAFGQNERHGRKPSAIRRASEHLDLVLQGLPSTSDYGVKGIPIDRNVRVGGRIAGRKCSVRNESGKGVVGSSDAGELVGSVSSISQGEDAQLSGRADQIRHYDVEMALASQRQRRIALANFRRFGAFYVLN